VNVSHEVQGQPFEWDSAKAAANLDKHGVSFERACEVFFDPFVVLVEAGEEDGEPREAAIGLTEDWSLLFVVHVIRHEETIRIISARPATPSERNEYEDV
jgi:uncharacterized DUF497 family protein